MQGGLPGGVGPADHVDVLPAHGGGFRARRAVEHPHPDQPVQGGDPQGAVGHPGRNEHRPPHCRACLAQGDQPLVAGWPDPGRPLREHELGAEQHRLLPGPVRQSGTADAAGKAQVVADHRAAASLPADGPGLHDQGAQTLGGAVHGGRQPGRPGAQDHQVVGLRRRPGGDPVGGRDLGVAGIVQHRAVVADHGGKPPHVDPEVTDQPPPALGAGGVELEGALLRASRSRSWWLRGDHCSPTMR